MRVILSVEYDRKILTHAWTGSGIGQVQILRQIYWDQRQNDACCDCTQENQCAAYAYYTLVLPQSLPDAPAMTIRFGIHK